jgi:hypothetical protein
MDSACAKNGSHAMMLKKEGMGDKDPNDPDAFHGAAKHSQKLGLRFGQ